MRHLNSPKSTALCSVLKIDWPAAIRFPNPGRTECHILRSKPRTLFVYSHYRNKTPFLKVVVLSTNQFVERSEMLPCAPHPVRGLQLSPALRIPSCPRDLL